MAESVVFTKTAERSVIYDEITPQIAAAYSGRNRSDRESGQYCGGFERDARVLLGRFLSGKGRRAVLGPFQGPLACTRIAFGKGVCGHAYSTRENVIVPDVDAFPGHIACSSASRSEIVVPMFDGAGEVFAVLDVDSERLDDFSHVDARGLGGVVKLVEQSFAPSVTSAGNI